MQVAVADLGPTFATAGRAAAAAALAAAWLAWRRPPLPPARLLGPLAVVAAGVVVGFPLLTALALQDQDSAHGAVIVGLLPAATFAMIAQTGDIYYGLWYPIVIALATVVIGILFVPETHKRDLFADAKATSG